MITILDFFGMDMDKKKVGFSKISLHRCFNFIMLDLDVKCLIENLYDDSRRFD